MNKIYIGSIKDVNSKDIIEYELIKSIQDFRDESITLEIKQTPFECDIYLKYSEYCNDDTINEIKHKLLDTLAFFSLLF